MFRGRVKKRGSFYYEAWIEKIDPTFQGWYLHENPKRFITQYLANRYIKRALDNSTES
jgi:hypothetical protein